ncbi:asparagine synthase (glutamine-hydrolyzing) [bacterium]|nr:asparagine synthase (glutamine-hydrolyzing) [bacterium]
MCGIAGFLAFDNSLSETEHMPHLERMTALQANRGPDDEGYWIDPRGRVAFGFRRLAILDLSIAGHQPMHSSDGRSALVMNGEIYNFKEIRHELESHGLRFRSGTDTEVLLEALNLWGAEDVLDSVNGMFAFAFYERDLQRLTLARDHAGIKPLYYMIHSGQKGISFGSQYNVLFHAPWEAPTEINEEAFYLYLRLQHIPPPQGLYRSTFQLRPGSFLQISAEDNLKKKDYWKLPRHVGDDFITVDEALPRLEQTLSVSVDRHRIADVPVGVFLSGGIDSPLITSVARQQVGRQLKAFTISIPGWEQDEAQDAAQYARHLGIDHQIIEVSGDDAISMIDNVVQAQHEPFADYSIIPTMLVSRFSRPQIKVALSGDGGDELFFGYERPLSLLRNGNDFRFNRPTRIGLYAAGRLGLIEEKSDVIVHRSPAEYYFKVNSRLSGGNLVKIIPGFRHKVRDHQEIDLYRFGSYQNEMDLANYSRYVEFYGQLQRGLKKVDMASAHFGLEVRTPLLDREIIALSLRINPFDMMKNQNRKWVLRHLLEKYVPPEMIDHQKRGFAIPLGEWLRGPLREKVENTLFDRHLFPEGLFSRPAVMDYWQEHLSGAADHKWGLWTLLALQWWSMNHRTFIPR